MGNPGGPDRRTEVRGADARDEGPSPDPDAPAGEARMAAARRPRPRAEGSSSATLERLVAATEGPQPGRRLFHAFMGLLLWGGLRAFDLSSGVAGGLLGVGALAALLLDFVRLRNPAHNRLFFRVLTPFASPRERAGIASSTWYLAGAAAVVLLFARPVAEASILVLALADPAASWFGRRHGRLPFGTGTVLGSGIFLAVAFAILTTVVGPLHALLAATAVTGAEALPWRIGRRRVDDNLVVPLVTGMMLTLLG